MTPDLGKYAVEVVSAYAVSLTLLMALIVMTVLRSRKVKADLEAAEARAKGNGDA